MKRDGIIHAELARALAALRHTDTFVIADAGLPIPAGVTCIDLGYRYGQPSFVDVSATVLAEVVVEHSWMSRGVEVANPAVLAHIRGLGLQPQRIEHEAFKKQAAEAAVLIRTGEATKYANLLCRAGVAFG
ncbi:MAG: D-ribose pyranase [Sciscionella sp.]